MSEHLYLLSIGLPLVTLLVIFGMKYFSNLSQARVRILEENAYRSLAQKAVAAQSDAAASLAVLQSELSQITARLTGIEKILKEVE
jgi:hypothetical protein